MPKTLRERLQEKGWSGEEIEHAVGIIYSQEKKEKHLMFTQFSSPLIYWSLLIVAIIGNFIASVVLIPIMLFLSQTQLYVVIGILALCFGAFFNILLKDIEHVDYQHHIMGGLFIPTIAFINVFVIVNLANKLNMNIINPIIHPGATALQQNAFLVTAVYIIAFIIPYAWYKMTDFMRIHKDKIGALLGRRHVQQ